MPPWSNLFSGNKKNTDERKETTSDGGKFVGYKFWSQGQFDNKIIPSDGFDPDVVNFNEKPPNCHIYTGTLTNKDGSIFRGSVEVRGNQYTIREGVTQYPGGKFDFHKLVQTENGYKPERETMQVPQPEPEPVKSMFPSNKPSNQPLKVGQYISKTIADGIDFKGYVFDIGDGKPQNVTYIGVIHRNAPGERSSWKSNKHDIFVGLVRCVVSDDPEYKNLYNKYYVDDGYGKFIKVRGVCIKTKSPEMFFGKYSFFPILAGGVYPGIDNTEKYDGVHYDYRGYRGDVIRRGLFTSDDLVKGVNQGPYKEDKEGPYCVTKVYNEEYFLLGHTFDVSPEGRRTKKIGVEQPEQSAAEPEPEPEPEPAQGGRKTRRKRCKQRKPTRRRRRRR
jgi:hypothetical protein